MATQKMIDNAAAKAIGRHNRKVAEQQHNQREPVSLSGGFGQIEAKDLAEQQNTADSGRLTLPGG